MAKKVSKAEFKHSMSKRMVSVSDTKFDEKTKKVRGPGGKLFTGAVDMGNGRTQTYENGVRVKVSAAKKGFRGAPTSKGKGRPAAPAKAKATTSRVSPSARGEGAGARTARSTSMGKPGQKPPAAGTGQYKGKRPASKTNYGNVRGVGQMQGMTAAQKSKRLKEAEAKRRYDRSAAGQRKNAAGILGLTGAAALAAGTPLGVGAAAAGARAAGTAGARAAAGASRVTRPVLGGTSQSGRSTSNKAAIAAFKAQKRLAAVKKALAKKRKK